MMQATSTPDRQATSSVPMMAAFIAVLIAVVLGTLGIVFGAVALATRQSAAVRPVQPVRSANPWAYQMTNPGSGGMQLKGVAHSTTNLEEWLDHNGVPIAAVGQVGGLKVFGDNIGVNPPNDVNQSSVVLHDTGGVTVAIHGPTLYGGAAFPSMACTTGDYYFRQSLTPGTRIYECNAGRWVPIF